MNIKFVLTAFLAAALTVSSCQKDSTSPTPATTTYPVEGLWIGTFTVDNNPSQAGTYYFSYSVYPDNTILVKTRAADGNNYYSIGTWSLSNSNEFSATFTSTNFNGPQVTQGITANFSDSGKMTNGIWT
ncbi:MAG TPA: hypothetical protein VLS85_12030, partial [Hanamia sp.]|nr:hypothetical protein [Hanamia sp.]